MENIEKYARALAQAAADADYWYKKTSEAIDQEEKKTKVYIEAEYNNSLNAVAQGYTVDVFKLKGV